MSLRDGGDDFTVTGANKKTGAFVMPTLFSCERGLETKTPHEVEAFGHVSTVIGYDSTDEAIALVKKGRGSLVGSVVTNNDDFAAELVLGVASHHGRFVVHNRHCYKESTGHGSPYADACSWWTGACWWRRRDGRYPWCVSLYAKNSYSGQSTR